MEYTAGQTQQVAVRNPKGRWQALQGDEFTGAAAFIDVAHLMVHAGRYFTAPDVDTDVDIATPKEWLFVTPDDDDLEVHVTFGVYSSRQCTLELFEDAETSADGTEITPLNHRRVSTYESAVAVYADPTVTADGTRIDVTGVGSQGGAMKLGGGVYCPYWDIKPNTKYLLRVTVAADDAIVTLQGDYYEFDVNDLTWVDPASSSSA